MAAKAAAKRWLSMIAEHRLPPLRQAGATVSGAGSIRQVPSADEPRPSVAHLVSRPQLFSLLYLLGITNALATVILPAIRSEDPYQELAQVLDIVTLAGIVVAIHLLRQMPHGAVRSCDWAAAALIAPLLLVPHRAGSWLAVTGLALYAICRDRQSVPAVAAASIFLALAVSTFWAQALVQVFSSMSLALDAALAAAMLDVLVSGPVDRLGNVITSSEHTTLLVLVGCSSLPNLCHGCLWWITIARALRPEWQSADLLALLAVGGLVLIANTLRLALMALSSQTYQWIHGPAGGNAFNIGLLLVIAATALYWTGSAASSLRR